MKQIVVFGNCQKSGIKLILEKTLPESGYEISFCSNTPRAGGFLSNEQLDAEFKKADILIYQPLDTHHYFNEERMAQYHCRKIKFPYIFNNGISSLGYAPMSVKNPYGEVFGEDILLDLFKEYSLEDVLAMYKEHQIDFDVLSRFDHCLDEMRIREQSCDIKLAPFIQENYKDYYLFITHNHPSLPVFREIAKQVCILLEGPEPQPFDNWLNCFGYSYTGHPISPYDVQMHGYRFGYHTDWFDRGKKLIETVFFYHKENKHSPSPGESSIFQPFPDSNVSIENITLKNEPLPLFESSYLISVLINTSDIPSDLIEKLKQLNISYADFYLNLGSRLIDRDDLGSAEKMLIKALDLEPEQPMPHFKLSQVYARKGEVEKAIKKVQDAISLQQKNPIFYFHLGNLLMRKGDLNSAEKALKKALEIDPKLPGPDLQLKKIYSRQTPIDR